MVEDITIDERPQKNDYESNKIEFIRGISTLPNGVANLIFQLTKAMKANRAIPKDILKVQRSICEQFGIYLPECFDNPGIESMVMFENQLGNKIEKIIMSNGPKKWISAKRLKSQYPELADYSEIQIGIELSKRGLPKRNTHGHKKYLLPSGIERGDVH